MAEHDPRARGADEARCLGGVERVGLDAHMMRPRTPSPGCRGRLPRRAGEAAGSPGVARARVRGRSARSACWGSGSGSGSLPASCSWFRRPGSSSRASGFPRRYRRAVSHAGRAPRPTRSSSRPPPPCRRARRGELARPGAWKGRSSPSRAAKSIATPSASSRLAANRARPPTDDRATGHRPPRTRAARRPRARRAGSEPRPRSGSDPRRRPETDRRHRKAQPPEAPEAPRRSRTGRTICEGLRRRARPRPRRRPSATRLPRRALDGVLEQSGLPDAWVATDHECAVREDPAAAIRPSTPAHSASRPNSTSRS